MSTIISDDGRVRCRRLAWDRRCRLSPTLGGQPHTSREQHVASGLKRLTASGLGLARA
jgi:hypothetical protein